ncbi:MAG TPA: VOC family protein [Gaiellaceae bacterium]|nr:VOC family protein [Gaiellaceae bacterium]
MRIDHLVSVVPDAAEAVAQLRTQHGLGSEAGPYLPFAGTRGFNVPLEPPAYVEILSIEDRDAAESSVSGRTALAREAAGGGLFAWAVLVEDVEVESERLGIDVFDFTVAHGDGTLRGWRAVSGPPHLPFFIDYPNNGDRLGRWQAMYDRVGHTCAPLGFTELTISGSRSEMSSWLGDHVLPLRFVAGTEGIQEARIATASGEVVIR